MKHRLISEDLSVSIDHFGAEICSVKNSAGMEFIWQADKDVWARHAPVLFPIVGKLQDNKYVYLDKAYDLPQHGFARDQVFELISSSTHSCRFQLRSSKEIKQKYPFEFIFEIGYELQNTTLITSYTIKNPASQELLFSVGAHPGFNCPLTPGETFEDYYLLFEKDLLFQTKLNNGLRTKQKSELKLKDKKLFLSIDMFDNDALVFENAQVNSISLCSSKTPHKITLHCNNWPYFGIWAKKGCDRFVCLEPWYGIADPESSDGSFARKDGIIRLEPGKDFSRSFSLSFT